MFQITEPVHIYGDNSSSKTVIEGEAGQLKNFPWVVIKAQAVLEEEKLENIGLLQVDQTKTK